MEECLLSFHCNLKWHSPGLTTSGRTRPILRFMWRPQGILVAFIRTVSFWEVRLELGNLWSSRCCTGAFVNKWRLGLMECGIATCHGKVDGREGICAEGAVMSMHGTVSVLLDFWEESQALWWTERFSYWVYWNKQGYVPVHKNTLLSVLHCTNKVYKRDTCNNPFRLL